jgi:hypothetical protein
MLEDVLGSWRNGDSPGFEIFVAEGYHSGFGIVYQGIFAA